MPDRKTYIIESDARPAPLNVIGEAITVFGEEDQDKPFELHLQRGNRGGGPPPHHHPWDEAFYVLDGEVEVTVADKTCTVTAGAYVHVPAGVVHAYTNLSEQAMLLGVVSDSAAGRNFRELHEHVSRLPDDIAAFQRIAASYNVTFV